MSTLVLGLAINEKHQAKKFQIQIFLTRFSYCIPGNFSDVEILANLAINSFSLKLQVANLVLHCSPSTSIKVCTMENEKLAKIKSRNRLIFWKTLKILVARFTWYTVTLCKKVSAVIFSQEIHTILYLAVDE